MLFYNEYPKLSLRTIEQKAIEIFTPKVLLENALRYVNGGQGDTDTWVKQLNSIWDLVN